MNWPRIPKTLDEAHEWERRTYAWTLRVVVAVLAASGCLVLFLGLYEALQLPVSLFSFDQASLTANARLRLLTGLLTIYSAILVWEKYSHVCEPDEPEAAE